MMNFNGLVKRKISAKIVAAIVCCSILVASLVGATNLLTSKRLLQNEVKEKLQLVGENKAKEFNITILNIESSVNDLATTISGGMDLDKAKTDPSYIYNYENNIQGIVKKFGETTKGATGIYFYLNPELIGGVHEAWYADKNSSGNFQAAPLGNIEDFTPSNKDMGWYYKPINARKAIWLDSYIDNVFKYL